MEISVSLIVKENQYHQVQKLKKNKTHSKGGGSLETVHHNVLCGPDAVECIEKEDFSTNKESIDNA